MSLDLAISVATGTKFLNRMTRQGTALYAALEDSEYRLKERQEERCLMDAPLRNIYT